MSRKPSVSAAKWVLLLVLALLLATTTLAAAQSPDLHLPLVTREGQTDQVAPDTPLDEEVGEAAPPLLEPGSPLGPNTPAGDSRDTNSGDYDVPAEMAAIDAFNATQWTVQNNLGIGTQTPTADIDLSRNVNNYTRIWVRNPNAGANAQTQLYLNTASTNGLVVQQFGSGYSATWNGLALKNIARLRTTPGVTGLVLTTGGNYPLILGTSDQERMRITPDGKVGIGITAPAHQLSIAHGPPWTQGSWGGSVELTNGGAIGWGDNGSTYSFGMGRSYAGFYIFRTKSAPGTTGSNAVYDLFIDNDGNFGIGTIFPNYKLHVSGSAYIENSLFVNGQQMNVPDYVFEPEYPLMSLDELRTYVAEEKHLPNVPNAEQIAQGGLNVTDFQMKLLEKTEELTLYTLAQDDQIQSLQQENHSLGEQVETLQQENRAMQQMIAGMEKRLAALEEQE